MKKRRCRKMARLGRENARGGSREERNGGHQPEISGLGVTSFGGYLAQQSDYFGLSQKNRAGDWATVVVLVFLPKISLLFSFLSKIFFWECFFSTVGYALMILYKS